MKVILRGRCHIQMSFVLLAVSFFLAGSTAIFAKTVAICHYQPENEAWRLISINENALERHLANHDNAVPGGVTAKTRTRLDEACSPLRELACPCWAEEALRQAIADVKEQGGQKGVCREVMDERWTLVYNPDVDVKVILPGVSVATIDGCGGACCAVLSDTTGNLTPNISIQVSGETLAACNSQLELLCSE